MSDEIIFVETDSEKLASELINDFETAVGETLYPGDERRIFLLQEVPVIVGLKNDINYTGSQNLLRNATGEMLDALGERTDTPRIPAQKASVTLQFTLSASQVFDVTIPAGTRATPDGRLFFETSTQLVIAAGQTNGSVKALSTTAGAEYNGFAPGQISTLVDPVAYVSGVSNTDTSSGGDDMEPDDDGVNVWSGYRERIRGSYSKPSTAGAEETYIFWARTADKDIADVAVTSPGACQVKITVLMVNGGIPSQDVLDAVLEVCGSKKVKPLTDQVTTEAPATSNYAINFTYYISSGRSAEEALIRSAIEDAGGAVEQYINWQKSKLGRAINPDYLRQLVMNAGAHRLTVTGPAFTAIAVDAVANNTAISITYGGLE